MPLSQQNLSREYISNESLTMMRRVLEEECARRAISPDHGTAKDFAAVIMKGFQAGMTEEAELVVLIRNLSD